MDSTAGRYLLQNRQVYRLVLMWTMDVVCHHKFLWSGKGGNDRPSDRDVSAKP